MASLKDVLEGRPLRSPIHAALVHLPLALFPVSVLLDLAAFVWPRPELMLVRGAFFCLCGGLVTGLLAAVFGMIDYTSIRPDSSARRSATLHLVLNVVALGLFALSAGLRYPDLAAARPALAPLLVSLAAFGLMGYAGYVGGHLVYSEGVGVGRHRRRTSETPPTREVPAGAEPVAVAREDELAEGATLRVSLGGTVVTLARRAGAVHAVQEFCTHRYAPLSEGCVAGGEIVCPWHGSKFDLRTGAVLQGPAKVPLRTFPAACRDGKIWVQLTPDRGA